MESSFEFIYANMTPIDTPMTLKTVHTPQDSQFVIDQLRNRTPFLWRNPNRIPLASLPPDFPLSLADIRDADARLRRFAPLLASLFPELEASEGLIESDLIPAPRLAERFKTDDCLTIPGTLMIKGDHALPVAGSVKARGGIYAVLKYAETVAFEAGLIEDESDDYTRLGTDRARTVFGRRRLTVGSTGNLGLSIDLDENETSRNSDGELFGLKRLEAAIREHAAAGAADIRDAVLERLDAFRGDAPMEDDVTLVLLKLA